MCFYKTENNKQKHRNTIVKQEVEVGAREECQSMRNADTMELIELKILTRENASAVVVSRLIQFEPM
jgi:hypothetical protein